MEYFRRLRQTKKSTYSLAGHKQASWSRERTRTACIFTQLSNDLCLYGACPSWNGWSHRNRVTHGSQNWRVYFLTITITHKGNAPLAIKVSAYSSKPALKAVSSSQFASVSITPTYTGSRDLELSTVADVSDSSMLQMALRNEEMLPKLIWMQENRSKKIYWCYHTGAYKLWHFCSGTTVQDLQSCPMYLKAEYLLVNERFLLNFVTAIPSPS